MKPPRKRSQREKLECKKWAASNPNFTGQGVEIEMEHRRTQGEQNLGHQAKYCTEGIVDTRT